MTICDQKKKKNVSMNRPHSKEKHSLRYFFNATCVNYLNIKGICELLALCD